MKFLEIALRISWVIIAIVAIVLLYNLPNIFFKEKWSAFIQCNTQYSIEICSQIIE